MQHHKYSLTELENMIPWEREIYITLLMKYLQEEADKLKAQQTALDSFVDSLLSSFSHAVTLRGCSRNQIHSSCLMSSVSTMR